MSIKTASGNFIDYYGPGINDAVFIIKNLNFCVQKDSARSLTVGRLRNFHWQLDATTQAETDFFTNN